MSYQAVIDAVVAVCDGWVVRGRTVVPGAFETCYGPLSLDVFEVHFSASRAYAAYHHGKVQFYRNPDCKTKFIGSMQRVGHTGIYAKTDVYEMRNKIEKDV